jgi:hypothetical protein
MSLAQSFTSMAAWPKSKSCQMAISCGLENEKGEREWRPFNLVQMNSGRGSGPDSSELY